MFNGEYCNFKKRLKSLSYMKVTGSVLRMDRIISMEILTNKLNLLTIVQKSHPILLLYLANPV